MNIKPLHNQVVIKQNDDETMYNGKLFIPDMGKEKPLMGEVIAVGPGLFNNDLQRVPMSVKVGDIVAFPAFGGVRITINNEDYIISREADLLAILENAQEV